MLEWRKKFDGKPINLLYYKICNIQILVSPHNIDPARLLTIRLLHRLNRSMWVAIFPQKATTTVCLGFFINPSSMPMALYEKGGGEVDSSASAQTEGWRVGGPIPHIFKQFLFLSNTAFFCSYSFCKSLEVGTWPAVNQFKNINC